MKQRLGIVSKVIVYLMGAAVFIICAILLPEIAREEAVANPHAGPALPFLVAAWIMALPIFIALHQTLRLLSFIDKDKAFSNRSVKTLQNIKNCALVFISMIIMGTIMIVTLGRSTGEDVTPFITLGFVITFVTCIIAAFAAVLKRLLQDAIALKSENDLTV